MRWILKQKQVKKDRNIWQNQRSGLSAAARNKALCFFAVSHRPKSWLKWTLQQLNSFFNFHTVAFNPLIYTYFNFGKTFKVWTTRTYLTRFGFDFMTSKRIKKVTEKTRKRTLLCQGSQVRNVFIALWKSFKVEDGLEIIAMLCLRKESEFFEWIPALPMLWVTFECVQTLGMLLSWLFFCEDKE